MVGCRLRMDISPTRAFLRLAHQLHCLLAADVLDIHDGSGFQGNLQIPFHHGNLRLPVRTTDAEMLRCLSVVDAVTLNIGRVFLMETDGDMVFRRQFHGFPGKLCIQNGDAIIGDAHRTFGKKALHIHQFLPLHPFSDIDTGFHMDVGGASFL